MDIGKPDTIIVVPRPSWVPREDPKEVPRTRPREEPSVPNPTKVPEKVPAGINSSNLLSLLGEPDTCDICNGSEPILVIGFEGSRNRSYVCKGCFSKVKKYRKYLEGSDGPIHVEQIGAAVLR
jgi:hypothetical protein